MSREGRVEKGEKRMYSRVVKNCKRSVRSIKKEDVEYASKRQSHWAMKMRYVTKLGSEYGQKQCVRNDMCRG